MTVRWLQAIGETAQSAARGRLGYIRKADPEQAWPLLACSIHAAQGLVNGGIALDTGACLGRLTKREDRNPSTGATIKVPAKTVVKFKVTKDLANAVA